MLQKFTIWRKLVISVSKWLLNEFWIHFHFWVNCSFKNRWKLQQYPFRFLQAFNALCKWIFERLPAHSGEYSHTILRLIFVVEWKGRPPHPTQRVNVCVRIRRNYVSLHQWFCPFFPHYFIYFIIVLEVLAVGAVAGWLAHELAHAVSWSRFLKSCHLSKRESKGPKKDILSTPYLTNTVRSALIA